MGLDYKYAFGKRWSRGNGLLPPDKDFLAIKAIKDQQAAGSCAACRAAGRPRRPQGRYLETLGLWDH